MVVQLTRRVRLFAGCTGGGHPSSENDRPRRTSPRRLSYLYSVHECYIVYLSLMATAARMRLSPFPWVPHYHHRPFETRTTTANYHHHRALVVRVPGLLFLPEFLLLSTVKGLVPILPTPSTTFARRLE